MALFAGCLLIAVGVFVPLLKRPVVSSTLSYYQHSHSSAAALMLLLALATAGYFFPRRWITGAAGLAIALITATVLIRLNAAFDQLVHPTMQLRAGTFLIFLGAALLIAASRMKSALPTITDVPEPEWTPRKPAPDTECKVLFAAWLSQRDDGTLTLTERQVEYERFRRLYDRGELDLIGLRHAAGEQKKK